MPHNPKYSNPVQKDAFIVCYMYQDVFILCELLRNKMKRTCVLQKLKKVNLFVSSSTSIWPKYCVPCFQKWKKFIWYINYVMHVLNCNIRNSFVLLENEMHVFTSIVSVPFGQLEWNLEFYLSPLFCHFILDTDYPVVIIRVNSTFALIKENRGHFQNIRLAIGAVPVYLGIIWKIMCFGRLTCMVLTLEYYKHVCRVQNTYFVIKLL